VSALTATRTLEPDIEIAAISGLRVRPQGSKTPAAVGRASELYPIAQPRFCRIFRSVPRPIEIAVATSSGSERMSTTSAVSIVHTSDGFAPPNEGPGDFPGGEIRGNLSG
jgi:hypothetical protein